MNIHESEIDDDNFISLHPIMTSHYQYDAVNKGKGSIQSNDFLNEDDLEQRLILFSL